MDEAVVDSAPQGFGSRYLLVHEAGIGGDSLKISVLKTSEGLPGFCLDAES